jgi:hypothetical protein
LTSINNEAMGLCLVPIEAIVLYMYLILSFNEDS